MNSKLMTVHEEELMLGEQKRIIGVLLNYGENFNDSIIYTYREGVYIFFKTIIEMTEYLLYGNKFKLRAYMKEADFDVFYDSPGINGKFVDHLTWIEKDE